MLDELWSEIRYRLRALLRGRDLDREMADEIAAHLACERAMLERQGLSPDEARRQARLAFGGVESVKESSRDARGTRLLEDGLRDLGYAWRGLRRSPGFAIPGVALLGLTIGSATIVFSVVNAVLLQPLPFADPERIVLVWETGPNAGQNLVGAHEFPEWARSNRTFDALSPIIYDDGVQLASAGEPAALPAVKVDSAFFDVMGVAPAIGRGFTADADMAGRGDAVVLSDRLWRSTFAADRGVVGRTIRLDDRPVQVVGVMPPGFAFPVAPAGKAPDLWLPIAENIERYVGRHYLVVVGRLKPGVTIAQAQGDLAGVAKVLEARYPADSGGHGVRVGPLHDSLVRDVRPSLLLLFGAVGSLLLIGCSNVASLLTARGVTRRRQVAMQLALGATRGRLARQLVVESLVLAGMGGACGVGLAVAVVGLVPALAPPGALGVHPIAVDRTVLTFAAGLAMLTGVIFGVVPALQVSEGASEGRLAPGGRALVGGGRRIGRALVVAQIALAVPLVFGAALMTRGLVALLRVDPGFAVESTLAVDLTLRGSAYAAPDRRRTFFDAVEQRLRQAPGVLRVGAVDKVPLGAGVSSIAIEIEDRPEQAGEWTSAQYRVVTPGYFGTIGVPLVAGRDFSPADARVALPLVRWFPQQPQPSGIDCPQPIPVAIVNESMARRLWPDGAIGRRFKVLFSPWITVAGVVRDMRTVSLKSGAGPEFYLSAAQEPQAAMTVLARTTHGPLDAAPVARAAIADVDPSVPIGALRTLEDVVDRSVGQPRFVSALMAAFAAMALVLMAVGVYGLLAFTTAQRLPEIGVRMALGATHRQVRGLMLSNAAAMTAVGLLLGVVAALGLGHVIDDQLFGVTPADPSTLAVVVLVVVATVGCACWLPVRRAARVDPITVLRHD